MRVWPGDQFRIYTPRSRFDLVFRGALPPAGPSSPVWQTFGGENPGEIRVLVLEEPASAGDGLLPGDGLGFISGYEITIGGGTPTIHPATPLPDLTSGGHTPGADVTVTVRALGFGIYPHGRRGALSIRSTPAGVEDPPVINVLLDKASGDTLHDKISGRRLISKWLRTDLPPRDPSSPNWQVFTGDAPGEIRIVVLDAPGYAGDGLVAGDGLGFLTGYQIAIAGGAAVTYEAAPLPDVTSTGHPPGGAVPVTVRAMGFGVYPNGRLGTLSSRTAIAGTAPTDPPNVLIHKTTGDTLIDKVSGDRLVSK